MDRIWHRGRTQGRNLPKIFGVVIEHLGLFFPCNTHSANAIFLHVGVVELQPIYIEGYACSRTLTAPKLGPFVLVLASGFG